MLFLFFFMCVIPVVCQINQNVMCTQYACGFILIFKIFDRTRCCIWIWPASSQEWDRKKQGVPIVSAQYAAEMIFVITNKCEFQIETVSS
jgi:hypothetical protein